MRSWRWLGLVLCAAVAAAQADKPVLRIEAGMHTASVRRISVDAAGRYLVSGSEDKTVRVWQLATGRLLRILRPPIGDDNEGMIFAVAISPDGRTVACGGRTGASKDRSIYLFDRESGRLTQRITGLPDQVSNLAYSQDRRFLAVALGSSGIRVYRTTDYGLAGEDRDYGGPSEGVDWSTRSPQRLVSSSFDGFVRLYAVGQDGSLRLLSKRQAPGGKLPYSVRFSPDGMRIAVCFATVANVNVLSAADLSLEFSPLTAGFNMDFYAVAWSVNGEFLYAGGRYHDQGYPVLRWAQGGHGASRQMVVADNTISDVAPLQNGGIAFGAGDPAVGVISADGGKLWLQGPPTADYRDNRSGFQVSSNGMSVGFAFEKDQSPAWFSLRDRSLKTGRIPADQRAVPPVTESLAVTDWEDKSHPKLNGKALPVNDYFHSLAIAPDKQSFLLGGRLLSRFDTAGTTQWTFRAPDDAWAVNISGDGKLAVAAFSDGTIRWYRYDDGKELLAFYPSPDRKRWVLWSPSGYYDASPGAEDLIGWHVNNGPDAAADFFPASRFRSTYYRPDVVGRILETRDEAEALRQAGEDAGRNRPQQSITQMLPPVISLLSPAEGSQFSGDSVTVRYSLRNPSGEPVTGVRALVDGRPLPAARRVTPVAGDVRDMEVTVPGKDCEITLIAENRFGASEPASVRLQWQGSTVFTIQPKLYILAVGISAYPAPYTLGFPAKDARDFVNALLPQKGRIYRDIESRILTDAQATREAVLDGLEWLERNTTQHDVAMVFLSGHGDNDARNGNYYFMPVNFDLDRLKSTAIAQSDILSTVQTLAGKALFFVDSCHSGNVLGGRARALPTDVNALVNELSSAENGAVVFAASSGRQVAIERDEWGNGAFTKAVVEGLNGKAAAGGSRITVNMLDLYISERVKELTDGQQTPTTAKPKTISDFPVAVAR